MTHDDRPDNTLELHSARHAHPAKHVTLEVTSPFYRLDSGGARTNLQFFALSQARRYWDEVRDEVERNGEELVDHTQERCAFAIAAMGLSLAQLLGQNPVTVPVKKVGEPVALWKAFVAEHQLDPDLVADFQYFDSYYGAIRHFGVTRKGSKHVKAAEITLEVTERCMAIGERVWREVRGVYAQKPGDPLSDLDLSDSEYLAFTFEEDEDPGPIL